MLRLRLVFAGLLLCLLAGVLLDRCFPPPIENGRDVSILVTDRHDRPLRAFPRDKGSWRFAADLEQVDPVFIDALLEVEDKRYWQHGGVDWVGMGRALWTSLKAGRIVSGGSTISMQTARLLEPRPKRSIMAKLIEMWRAHQLEWRLSKKELLELYLTLAPYGGNLEGVRAASWRYFGRAPDRLSDDQIALLIALPQSPEKRRPDRYPEGARAGRQTIVHKLERLGFLSSQRADEASSAPLPEKMHAFPDQAWHAAAKARRSARKDVVSTIDGPLQAELERLVRRHAEALESEAQIAALIVDIPSRAVRAAIGSAGRDRPGGWLDLTAQARSPGSTLKPFIYGLAFDEGLAAPATRISDLPTRFAAYQPENFDRLFRGDVRIDEALQHSLNIPAVLLLDRIGAQRFTAALSLAGARPRIPQAAEAQPGLALALGGAGLTMQELARLYAALGDGGIVRPLIWQEEKLSQPVAADSTYRLMRAESADRLVSILRDTPTPEGRIPGRLTSHAPQIAFKTGTSYGYRDAWAAGISGQYAILVWIGRADGAPRPGATGRKAALPVLFEVTDRVAQLLGQGERAQTRLMDSVSERAQGALQHFDRGLDDPEILFPPAGASLWAGPVNGQAGRPFVFSGRGKGPLSWFVDGEPVPLDAGGLPAWKPDRSGFYTIIVVDADGRSQNVQVRILFQS